MLSEGERGLTPFIVAPALRGSPILPAALFAFGGFGARKSDAPVVWLVAEEPMSLVADVRRRGVVVQSRGAR